MATFLERLWDAVGEAAIDAAWMAYRTAIAVMMLRVLGVLPL